MEVLCAIVMGLGVWLAKSNFSYTYRLFPYSPVFLGFLAGLILGDVSTGLLLGGTIELLFLGVIAAGGVMPTDKTIAAAVVVPLAIQSGMTAEVAVTLAVPVAVLGTLLWNVKKVINAYYVHMGDKCVENGDTKGLWRCSVIYPLISNFVLLFLPIFLVNLYGVNLAEAILNVIPPFVQNGLNVACGLLPAIGFATILMTIGKPVYIPFFIMGFFLVKYFGLSTIGVAIFGICAVLLIVTLGKERGEA